MEIQKFIKNFAAQFEETEANVFSAKTKFRDIDEWSSLMAFSIIAMVDTEYNVIIKGDDIKASQTIEDIYNIVKSRL
jgi:acyl carrier protein